MDKRRLNIELIKRDQKHLRIIQIYDGETTAIGVIRIALAEVAAKRWGLLAKACIHCTGAGCSANGSLCVSDDCPLLAAAWLG